MSPVRRHQTAAGYSQLLHLVEQVLIDLQINLVRRTADLICKHERSAVIKPSRQFSLFILLDQAVRRTFRFLCDPDLLNGTGIDHDGMHVRHLKYHRPVRNHPVNVMIRGKCLIFPNQVIHHIAEYPLVIRMAVRILLCHPDGILSASGFQQAEGKVRILQKCSLGNMRVSIVKAGHDQPVAAVDHSGIRSDVSVNSVSLYHSRNPISFHCDSACKRLCACSVKYRVSFNYNFCFFHMYSFLFSFIFYAAFMFFRRLISIAASTSDNTNDRISDTGCENQTPVIPSVFAMIKMAGIPKMI